jgi:hypothetical protein
MKSDLAEFSLKLIITGVLLYKGMTSAGTESLAYFAMVLPPAGQLTTTGIQIRKTGDNSVNQSN